MFELPFDYLKTMGLWLLFLPALLYGLLQFRRWCKRRQRGLGLANLGLSLWLLLVGLTLVELYFAVIYDQSDSFNITNVSKKWFQRWVTKKPLRFGSYEGIGYRDDVDFPLKVSAGQKHLCFIGDSFTFGHGVRRVSDRFSNLVRARLDLDAPGRFLVTNIADAGTDLYWVSEVTDRLIESRLPVDTLIYVVCLNDIEAFDPNYRDMPRKISGNKPTSFLIGDTYFFNLLYFRAKQATVPEARDYYSHVQEHYRGPAWNRMFAKLSELKATCSEAGIELRLVIFPFLHNLGPEYPFRDAHERIADFCRRDQVPFLDLLPVLEPHANERLTVNLFDAHPNERAHALAAEAIERDLLADLISRESAGGDNTPAPQDK